MALTQQRAEDRSKHIKHGSITYDFHVSLNKGQTYSGYAQISFALDKIPSELVLDFKGKQVNRVVQNNTMIETKLLDGFIYLEAGRLTTGINTVGVHYCCKYDNDGSGCVSFIDENDKQYISTQFAPYYANRVFPCFDQPDLKAKMRLSVISPVDWKKILSNETSTIDRLFNFEQYTSKCETKQPEEIIIYLQGKTGNMTLFPETKMLSTYLYCLVAGQYISYHLPENQRYKNIPMSLYCTSSLEDDLKRHAPFIFELTIESMKFYESFFNYSFPFEKYDQIFAHQYKWGAMENAGAVVINDNYLFRDTVSTARMFAFANIISHELSHHWFGNLVTMKWWDDVWLNETFATFISYLCLQKIQGRLQSFQYESAMSFFLKAKKKGYDQDQMITTHPIRGRIANTNVADSIFDGITYNKGAATMKQICFLMSQESFGKGLSSYFKKYEWNNATIDDFLAEMQKFFFQKEFTLPDWKHLWLESASLNVLEPEWNINSTDQHSKLLIKQSAYTSTFPTLRFHKIKVSFFRQNCQADSLDILVRPEKETILMYDGSRQYKAVLLNDQDQSFVKANIDPTSMDFFISNIGSIGNVLSRTLIWSNFYQMIKDAKFITPKFVEIIVNSLTKQSSDSLFQEMLEDVHLAITLYTPQKYRAELNDTIFRYLYHLLPKITDHDNRSTIVKSKITNFATSEENLHIMIGWINKQDQQLKGVQMPGLGKMEIATKAFILKNRSIQQKKELFTSIYSKFPLSSQQGYRLCCDSLISTEEEFDKIYESFREKESKYSVEQKGKIAKGWNHPYHKERLGKYKDKYFKDLQEMSSYMSGDHFAVFYGKLEPITEDLLFLIEGYQKVQLSAGRQKNRIDILKRVDQLKKRQKAYQLYQ